MIKRKSKALLCAIASIGFINSIEIIHANAYNNSFSDTKGHWAEAEISKFNDLGYISGYEDKTFKPNNSVTRAEFVKILNNVFGLTKSSGIVFTDTENHWAKNEIDIAVTNGVCKGKSTTEFKPNDSITREEAALMISNYEKLEDDNHNKLNAFNDAENVSDWAKDGVEGVIEKGYMNGYADNTFKPKGKITRAEAVITLSRVNKSEENLVAENANKVIDKINKLDRTITKNDENEILESRNAYNSLNDEAKSLVKNLDILERAERKSKVINLIDKIGRDDNKNDTVENRVNKYIEDVKKAKEAYDTLSEEEKNTISPLDREFLNGALVTVEQLNTEARDKAIAEKLVERISKLKSYEKYTQLDEKRAIAKEVYDIRGAYEGLTYTAKKIVTQEYLDILKKAELKILNSVGDLLDPTQKAEANKAEANKVTQKIEKLNRNITKNDENEILESRNAYNSLNDEAKSLVKNLDILERAERKSKVINLIDKIGRDDNKNDTVENRVNKYIEDVKKTIDEKVKKMLKLVALPGFEKRNIDSLSGGQQQRIAIARALVNEPKVLLLDEPLGALDLKLRQEMQRELKNIQQQLGITFIFVTHDQEEALSMSDTIVVMNKGKIQQMGSPEDIYNEPKNAFVARFIGESNIIDGVMHEDLLVEFCGRNFECVDKGFKKDEQIQVVIRPEDIKMVKSEGAMLTGEVTSCVFKGVHYEMTVESCGLTWLLHNTKSAEVGSILGMDIYPEDIHIMKKTGDDE